MSKVWNPFAIDYSKGVDITDLVTGKVYTNEQAKQLPKEIQTRLVLKGRVIGAFVEDIEEKK